ncbi:MAG: M56 family metallopeptidase [Bacteroidota bacterium]
MNSFLTYLFELNITLMVLFVAFKLFFERDSNFVVRRIYLQGVVLIPAILPLLPATLQIPVGSVSPVSINLEEITIFGTMSSQEASGTKSIGNILMMVYLSVLALGLLKLVVQFLRILLAIITSDRHQASGTTLLANSTFHASSFFGFIFIDPASLEDESIDHIIEHENIHRREVHSVDRILVELFVILNWFNPVVWMLRKSVIQNLEYLADSAVIQRGTDPLKYQLSILNQYIGSASITNQFSSQIKNRINMLNKNYKLGNSWKIAMLLPLAAIALFIVSCNDKEGTNVAETEIFFIVEEMPTFNDGDPAIEFRKYIAQNLRYPKEAAENGVTGKIFIKFIVDHEGKVVIPDQETLAKAEGNPLDEVVVATYRSLTEGDERPEENYIQLLKDEVTRVVSDSPDWKPGTQRGKNVNVLFTFPVNFALQ